MCGLVGVAGEITLQLKKAFDVLLYADVFRGPHSTGVGIVQKVSNHETETHVLKRVGGPWNLIWDSRQYERLVVPGTKVLMGHNRYATRGKVTEGNAHPFLFGNILAAHNGTIDNFSQLANYSDHDVDSSAVIELFNRNGIDDTIKKLIGAWAFTIFDIKTHKLTMVRNNERPLHFATVAGGKAIVWASEKHTLEFAIEQTGVNLETDSKNPHGIWSIMEDRALEWVIPMDNTVIPRYTSRKLEGLPRPPAQAYSGWYGNNRSYWNALEDKSTKNQLVAQGNVTQLNLKPPLNDATECSHCGTIISEKNRQYVFWKSSRTKENLILGPCCIQDRNKVPFYAPLKNKLEWFDKNMSDDHPAFTLNELQSQSLIEEVNRLFN